jgi:hypothetical protein
MGAAAKFNSVDLLFHGENNRYQANHECGLAIEKPDRSIFISTAFLAVPGVHP